MVLLTLLFRSGSGHHLVCCRVKDPLKKAKAIFGRKAEGNVSLLAYHPDAVLQSERARAWGGGGGLQAPTPPLRVVQYPKLPSWRVAAASIAHSLACVQERNEECCAFMRALSNLFVSVHQS